ncbi:hypothetical protein BGZ54_003588, partial [Gamsiella multidivaricata]
MKQYRGTHRLKQEVGKSEKEAKAQTAIMVNRITARVMQSVEKEANDHLDEIDHSIFQGEETEGGDEETEGGDEETEDEADSEDSQEIGEGNVKKIAMLDNIDVGTGFLTYQKAVRAHARNNFQQTSSIGSMSMSRSLCKRLPKENSEGKKSYSESAGIAAYIQPICEVSLQDPSNGIYFNYVDSPTIVQNKKDDKPDLAMELRDVQHKAICTMAIGEVTSQGLKTRKSKDTHDLERVATFLKEALEYADKKFGVEDAALVGLQVVANKMDVYVMARVGDIYVLAHQGAALEKSLKQGIELILKVAREG